MYWYGHWYVWRHFMQLNMCMPAAVAAEIMPQVVPDPKFQQQGNSSSSSSRLTFFLDGAHTPESMVTCGTWFAQVTSAALAAAAATKPQQQQQQVLRILVFNCMKERDPAVLLPHLHTELQQHNAAVHLALFVPPDSQYAFLPTSNTQQLVAEAHQDLSWQQQLRGVWQQCQAAAAAAAAAVSSEAAATAASSSAEQMASDGLALLPALPDVPGGLWFTRCAVLLAATEIEMRWLLASYCSRQAILLS
jgi:folylpolyglutamate synthase